MAISTDAPTIFARALMRLDGVGRVTARRLSGHFEDEDDLRSHSREEVFLRIKGVPNAEKIAERLLSSGELQEALSETRAEAEALAERGVRILSARSDAWPRGLGDLPPSQRPLLLWAYGPVQALRRPSAALLARPPMEGAPFERAQALAQHLTARGVAPVLGAQSGFDVAIAQRAAGDGAPVLLVAACGLAKVPRRLRPAATQAARAGGVLLSPFPMQHGPFDHDDRERAAVQAALARACVFAPAAEDTPEARALAWATGAGRPAFLLGSSEAGSNARPVRGPEDFDAVLSAAQEGRESRSRNGFDEP